MTRGQQETVRELGSYQASVSIAGWMSGLRFMCGRQRLLRFNLSDLRGGFDRSRLRRRRAGFTNAFVAGAFSWTCATVFFAGAFSGPVPRSSSLEPFLDLCHGLLRRSLFLDLCHGLLRGAFSRTCATVFFAGAFSRTCATVFFAGPFLDVERAFFAAGFFAAFLPRAFLPALAAAS